MEHPFIKNIKTFLIYISVWFVIAAVQFFILYYFYHFEVIVGIVDSLVFNLLFALLGFSIWYVIKYGKSEKNTTIYHFIQHVTSCSILVFIWMQIYMGILNTVFPNNQMLRDAFTNSIPPIIVLGVLYYSFLTLIYYLIIFYRNLQEKLVSEANLKEKVKEAELNMLKSQINPHFLFNSLNSISSLTITNPDKAQEMIIKLSDFLRYSISQPINNLTSFDSELKNIDRYLEIEKIRFGNRLIYSFSISDECFNKTIPSMILQPLYENAVKHGVYESTEPIEIKTIVKFFDKILQIKISNNFDSTAKSRKGAGIGLANIKERLRLIYKRDNLILISKNENFFEVEIRIPQ